MNGSVYIGEPEPGNQYRLFLIASGFGINVKLVGSFKPNPETGQVTAYFENLPQVPFEDFQLHLFAGERALMATPIACTIYTVNADFFPWDEVLPDQRLKPDLRPRTPARTAANARARSAPSTRAWWREPPTRPLAPSRSFTLKLNREDGDQFLGKLNFTMPPGLTANLHGITYCPEAEILAAAKTLGAPSRPNRAARRPLKSAPPTSPPARAPTPSTRSARSTWPGPSRARR